MSNVVLVKDLNEIGEMKIYYHRYLSDKNPPGSIFAAKTPACSITAYKSGKVLFQGSGCQEESAKWGQPAKQSESPKKGSSNLTHLPKNISTLSVIGSDEVGTGDYFGPITVVAAYVNKEQIPSLKELGVKDSKDLNDEKIVSIAKEIKDIIPYSLLTLHNEKYNKLQQSGMSQGKMKALLHNQAIGHLLKKIAPDVPEAILIDQFAKEEVYYSYLKKESVVQKKNVYFSTKAEGIHLAVAAASILARYAFIKHFDNLSKAAGFTITKGAGAKVDEAAARIIHENGLESLPAFVKLHFANTDKAKRLFALKYRK
ncbi:ribonuclease HIII [Bacillus sp. DTU_2020_1000418_1_SI_GHA_SEK_038]|uniref:ribonuclease HIII n=1 Tax=Bacillus sp. DTU_2020_1000418_1_SI_GHA_SEK_038 TaxID=3077585 RepID=UPI0028EBCC49|nr:ribonuclease HIII [Bacillus sp. DTU_2020_1000418_1_SI_GHA_SEK_038]WNS74532.1 ribonuclease HIII [Bacillus sp. DTU_2020_1000418_1_SI_GHA_SEK_038]